MFKNYDNSTIENSVESIYIIELVFFNEDFKIYLPIKAKLF